MSKFKRKKTIEKQEAPRTEGDLLGKLKKEQLRSYLEESKKYGEKEYEFSYVLCKIIGDITSEALYKNDRMSWKKVFDLHNINIVDEGMHTEVEDLALVEVVETIGEGKDKVTLKTIKNTEEPFADTVVELYLKDPYTNDSAPELLMAISALKIASFFIKPDGEQQEMGEEVEENEVSDPIDALLGHIQNNISSKLTDLTNKYNSIFREEAKARLERERERARVLEQNRNRDRNMNKSHRVKKSVSRT